MSNIQANLPSSIASEKDRYFDVGHLRDDLSGRSVRGGAVTMIAQASKFVLQIASTMVLARLLSPEEFGIVSMVIAITAFIQMFKDMGLSMATVQREEVNHAQVSTLFWVNVLVGVMLTIITAALAGPIAWFYKEPELVAVTYALSICFIFSGLVVQHQALLRRRMQFTALAVVEVGSALVSSVVAIIAAALGKGYWSLVYMHISLAVAMTVGMWWTCRWRPGRAVRGAGVRSMLAFGGNLMGFNLVNYFARNLDRTLIGWRWGAAPVGLYARAYSLLVLPIQQVSAPIAAVTVPSLSRLQQNPEQYRRYYLRAFSVLLFLTTPLTLFLVVAADETIAVVLGPQWSEAAGIFRCLAAASLVQPAVNSAGWIYLSDGRTKTLFRWGVVASIILCVSFVVGLPWGTTGVAACYAIASTLLALPGLHIATRTTNIVMLDIFVAARAVGISAVLAAAVTFAVRHWLCSNLPAFAALLLMFAVMATVYAVLVLFVFGKFDEYRSIMQTMFRRRS